MLVHDIACPVVCNWMPVKLRLSGMDRNLIWQSCPTGTARFRSVRLRSNRRLSSVTSAGSAYTSWQWTVNEAIHYQSICVVLLSPTPSSPDLSAHRQQIRDSSRPGTDNVEIRLLQLDARSGTNDDRKAKQSKAKEVQTKAQAVASMPSKLHRTYFVQIVHY